MAWRSCVSLGQADASLTRLISSQAVTVTSLEGVKRMGVSGGSADSARPATSLTSTVGMEMLAPRHLRRRFGCLGGGGG